MVIANGLHELGTIGHVTLLRSGALLATDLPTKRAILLSPSGAVVSIGGGEGRAPGQLLSISAMGVQGDSVVWAVDNVQQRFVQWRLPTLTHISTQSLERAFPSLESRRGLSLRTITPDGALVVSGKWALERGRPLSGTDSTWYELAPVS
jgi:hypothetical protein